MKRLLALVMCMALMMTSFVFVSAEADAIVTVATVTQNVKAGDTLRVPVTISAYRDAYATIVIGSPSYDSSKLEFVGYEESEKDFLGNAVVKTAGEDFGIITVPSSTAEAIALSYGEICLLVFTAKTDLTEDVAISVEVKELTGYVKTSADTTWVKFQDLTSEVVAGGIFTTASADATITVGTVEGTFNKGDEIAIPVNISEWANAYATIELTFSYNESLLTLDVIEASEDDFGGAMAATNDNKFSLVCNPSSDRQAKKLLGGEVCVAYFYAKVDGLKTATVTVSAIVKGYTNGKADNWVANHELLTNVVAGGVDNGEIIPPNPPIPDDPTDEPKFGDVNGDGEVNAVDAMVISQYYVGLIEEINEDIADVNEDGEVNAIDAMLISQYSVGMVETLPVK